MDKITELEYWETAAKDPAVDIKYIADVDTEECLKAIAPALGGENILEIGSGVGRLTISVSARHSHAVITGVDLSPKMIEIAIERATEAGVEQRCYFIQPHILEEMAPFSYDAAYSMLTFQHISPQQVLDYISTLAYLLIPGAIFRFQFVAGDYHAKLDHNYTTKQMVTWLKKCGFAIKHIEHGLLHKQWTWITAVRT